MKKYELKLYNIRLIQKDKVLIQVSIQATNRYEALNWLLDSSNSSREAYEDFRELIKLADTLQIKDSDISYMEVPQL